MRIIYITEQLYLYGGAEKILSQKLNYWADEYGFDVLLITSEQNKNEFSYPLSNKIKHIDLDIGYDREVGYFKWRNMVLFPKHYRLLKAEIKKFKPHAIFLISLSWIRIVLPILARRFNIYNEYHTSYYGFQLGFENKSFLGKIITKFKLFLIAFSESFYTNIIFLNETELDYYKRKNGVVIPNFFEDNNSTLNLDRENIIISLGRMNHQKGYDMLIDAWAKIDDRVKNWSIQIYGDGSDKEVLKDQLNTYNFKNEFIINDAIPDVNKKLLKSKIYVMSSRFETFPMVLLEALSCGLPVVSFDCPSGPRSILVENDDSLIARPNDIDDLANKLLILINDNSLRDKLSVKAKENVNRFNPSFVMNKWLSLIKSNL